MIGRKTEARILQLQEALRKAAADLELCAKWFHQAGRGTDYAAALNFAHVAKVALAGPVKVPSGEELKPAAPPAELPDEPWALNVAPRYTPGSPALVSRRTGEQVAKEERDAYERHLEGLYGPEGVAKASRLGLGKIVYERVREREAGRGANRRTIVTWLDIITGERYEESPR